MERVLVTGGAGFIGSHLVELLVDCGASVMVLDDFRRGRREHLGKIPSGRMTVVEGDIRSATDLQPVADFAPDTVFHLAAIHFIPYCIAHPKEALDVNVLGLETLLRALRPVPFERFVFPSSGAIYGFGDDPWPESAPPRPDEIYGLSKWMGEQVLARFHADSPAPRVAIARLFNTYGPRETNPHVLPDVMKAMGEGKPIELGNLWPKRDLIYVTDTAAGLMAAAGGSPGLEIFNVGTGIGTSIQDVMQAIEEITGNPLEIRQVPGKMRDGDGHLISDPQRLMHSTGWKPSIDLKTGLHRLLEWEGLA